MVAYSCQTQFVPDIQAGRKTHTIRGQRKRHARVGEPMQLYCKMRRPECFKIIPDPTCTFVDPINIVFGLDHIIMIWTGPECSEEILPAHFDDFARLDGFHDAAEMFAFWEMPKGSQLRGLNAWEFKGCMIGWGEHPLDVLYPKRQERPNDG